jgi:hypothetical protein
MLVDGGACVNIMLCTLFEKLGHKEEELMKTNMTLNGFSGKPSEAKGITLKELTVATKMMPMAFFVVEVKGRYNILLGQDWIHANDYVPSTLHQCVVQWIGDEVGVIHADDTACVALANAGDSWQDGDVRCLTRRNLAEFNYVSVGRDGFVPINVKTMKAIRLGTWKFKMMSKEDSIAWLQGQTNKYHSERNSIDEVVEDLDDIGKLGQGFTSVDELVEVNLGEEMDKRPMYINASLDSEQKHRIHELLREFMDCFA